MPVMAQSERSPLIGRCVLVVEDEVLVAMELESLLKAEGCVVVGPAPTNARALELIEQVRIDACVLDLDLCGEPAVPVARALVARSVPFALVTGYSEAQIPQPELRGVPRVNKPLDERALVRVLSGALRNG